MSDLLECGRCYSVVSVGRLGDHRDWCEKVWSLVVAQESILKRNRIAVLEELNRPWRVDPQP